MPSRGGKLTRREGQGRISSRMALHRGYIGRPNGTWLKVAVGVALLVVGASASEAARMVRFSIALWCEIIGMLVGALPSTIKVVPLALSRTVRCRLHLDI